jgi:hypothetical protein
MINPDEKLDEGLLNEMVIRFLRYKKFDVEATLAIILKTLKLGLAEEIVKIPYEDYKQTYDSQIFITLKKRAADGSKIVWVRAKNWNVDKLDLLTLMAGVYHYLDEALYSIKNQKHGVSLIVDVSGIGVITLAKILSFFTVDIITQLASFFQGAYPLRLKSIHFINSPLILISFFAGIKYLITKKMRDRLNLHYRGSQVLSKYFDKKFLPLSLSGCISDEEACDVKILKAVNKKGISGASNTLSLRQNFIIPN